MHLLTLLLKQLDNIHLPPPNIHLLLLRHER
jgi:hypothetical protein